MPCVLKNVEIGPKLPGLFLVLPYCVISNKNCNVVGTLSCACNNYKLLLSKKYGYNFWMYYLYLHKSIWKSACTNNTFWGQKKSIHIEKVTKLMGFFLVSHNCIHNFACSSILQFVFLAACALHWVFGLPMVVWCTSWVKEPILLKRNSILIDIMKAMFHEGEKVVKKMTTCILCTYLTKFACNFFYRYFVSCSQYTWFTVHWSPLWFRLRVLLWPW